jgi:hypothetical protein
MAGKEDDTRESRRILDRIDQETGSDLVSRTGRRLGDHLAAADVDQKDRIEVLGSRIGRTLGFLITVGIIVWLVWYVFGGGP